MRPPTVHHVRFVVASVEDAAPQFASSLGTLWDGEIIHDPLQEVRLTFLRYGASEGPALELLEPASKSSPLHSFLGKGGGLHHVCYEVDSLEVQLQMSRSAGGLMVKRPLPAVAFGGRLITWVFTREKLLVEYLERSRVPGKTS